MTESMITFTHEGLQDDDATRAENVNGLAGFNCAVWLSAELSSQAPDFQFDEKPVDEDWGWALAAKSAQDHFLLGCSEDEDTSARWRVIIDDYFSRGLFPWTRKRRSEAVAKLAQQVEAFLKSHPDVSNVTVETI